MEIGDTFFNSSPQFFSTGNEKQSMSLKNPQWKQQEKASERERESAKKSEAKAVDVLVACMNQEIRPETQNT